MASKKKNMGKLLRKYGYAFPQSEDEIKSFEYKFKEDYEEPNKWPGVLDIIKGKNEFKNVIKLNSSKNKSAANMGMAAREGKEISKKDREQMDKDKKDARKK